MDMPGFQLRSRGSTGEQREADRRCALVPHSNRAALGQVSITCLSLLPNVRRSSLCGTNAATEVTFQMWQSRVGLGISPRTILEELARIQFEHELPAVAVSACATILGSNVVTTFQLSLYMSRAGGRFWSSWIRLALRAIPGR